MRVPDGMHVEWIEGEAVILDSANGQLHYLNPTAALVFAKIEEMGYEAALEALRATYKDVAEFENELNDLLHELNEKGLLVNE